MEVSFWENVELNQYYCVDLFLNKGLYRYRLS